MAGDGQSGAGHVPLSLGHAPLDPVAIHLWRGSRSGALVAPQIAQVARGHDVARDVLPAVLAGQQVLCRASKWGGRTGAQAQLIGRAQPHRAAAVVATALLGVERTGAQGFEGLRAQWRAPESKRIPAPPLGGPRAPGAYWLCGHNTDALATGRRFIRRATGQNKGLVLVGGRRLGRVTPLNLGGDAGLVD